MNRRIAVVTMVYNESYFLPIWIDHYNKSVPEKNIYVIDDGSSDGSTSNLGNINLIQLPRQPFSDVRRTELVSNFCSNLLLWYDVVIYTDVDELLVPDPDIALDLQEYCDKMKKDVVTAIGLNVIQTEEEISPPPYQKPLLQCRRYVRFVYAMCKPVISRVPIKWSPRFHSSNHSMEVDDLFLFHLRHHDINIALQRLEKTRSQEWENLSFDHYQRWDDKKYQEMFNVMRQMERREDINLKQNDEVFQLIEVAKKYTEKGPTEKQRFYLDLPSPPSLLLRVPKRLENSIGPISTKRTPVEGTKSPDGHVTAGKDGWLFLTKGSNETLRLYQEEDYFTDEHVLEWLKIIERRTSQARKLNITYRHFFAPDKLSIYPEFFPYFVGKGPGIRIVSRQSTIQHGKNILDVETPLLRAKRQEQVYFKTDSHWNYNGCYVAYNAICNSLNIAPRTGLKDRPFSNVLLSLDLGSKFNPPILEEAKFHSVIYNSRRIEANDLVKRLEVINFSGGAQLLGGTRVVFQNKNKNAEDAKVVLFGDSYSEFRPHLLTGMLAETFREVHFVWSSSVDFDYAKKIGADIVISEIAERFVRRWPDDSRDIIRWAQERLNLCAK